MARAPFPGIVEPGRIPQPNPPGMPVPGGTIGGYVQPSWGAGIGPYGGGSGLPLPSPTPVSPTGTPEQLEAAAGYYMLLHGVLEQAGLGHLFTWDPATNRPGGFIWEEIVKKGLTTEAEIQLTLESNADYQKRFKVIFDLRAEAAAGRAIDTSLLNPANILEYEFQAKHLMEFYGMPGDFYDSYEDFQKLMVKGVTLTDLNKAVSESWNRVANTDPRIRAKYQEWYGGFGDAALAASFVDPEKMDANMDVFSRAAAIAGTGELGGINVDRGRAERLARFGFDETNVQQGFAMVEQIELDTLLDEIYGERDLTQADALDTAFGLDDGTARQAFEQRRARRRSSFEGGGGGALVTAQGAVGLGRYRSGS